MKPLYHCLICVLVKHVLSSRALRSSLLSFGGRFPIAVAAADVDAQDNAQ